ncbi:MAG TPA: DUF4136 domain-containing protein [Thermoanaerobaculia bacterium]|nr:DUF4136 domain-containing protein [Thermoanaerobaculia bacterium]
MRFRIVPAAALGLALLVGCATAPKTKVGWDQNVSFARYHTWAWRPDGSISDPTWARRCQDVLSDQLKTDGLKQVTLEQNPDLWGVIHARLSADTVVVPFSPDWGYGWGAWAPVDDYTEQIPVGTIIVDLVDVKMKHIVWRGRAKGDIDPSRSNEAKEEGLRQVLAQLFAGYPPATGAKPAGTN